VNVRDWSAVEQETQDFGPAVVAARVHELLALVDEREVEVGDHHAFAGADRFADQRAIGRYDRGKAAAGNRADAATAGVLGDLRLLIGVQPGCRADHETTRLQADWTNEK
jgi:hypothetical protein